VDGYLETRIKPEVSVREEIQSRYKRWSKNRKQKCKSQHFSIDELIVVKREKGRESVLDRLSDSQSDVTVWKAEQIQSSKKRESD
jgi:hypothetical protein